MKIAVITMVYNESFNLPVWVSHYQRQCPGCELFVIDHGSDENVRNLFSDVNVLRIPRSDFDERRRADMVSRLHGMLLLEFDWVLHIDCDELVVSGSHHTIAESLENESGNEEVLSINAVGMNIWHDIGGDELPYERARKVGEQRRFATFEKSMCKPFASRAPIAWIPGFHTSNLPPRFVGDFYLVHTKYIDHQESNNRRTLTSALNWSSEALENDWSKHQRIDSDQLTRKFESIAKFIKEGKISEFKFDDEAFRFVDESVKDSKGNWRSDAKFAGKIVEIPQDLLAKLP